MRKMFVLSACLLVASCAAAQNVQAIRNKALQKAEAACGDPSVKFHVLWGQYPFVLPPIAAGMARIYIIELGVPFYNPITRIGLDGNWIGATRGGSYIVLSVAAGQHHLCSLLQSGRAVIPSLANLTAVAGATYYFLSSLSAPSEFTTQPIDVDAIQSAGIDPDKAKLLLAESNPAVSIKIKKVSNPNWHQK